MELNKKNMTILGAFVGGPAGVKSFGGPVGAVIGVIGGMAVGWALGWVREWADALADAKIAARVKAEMEEARAAQVREGGERSGGAAE